LTGHWLLFGRKVGGLGTDPDWFLDSATGRRSPDSEYAFSIPLREPKKVGSLKRVWELSRHQHLTVLAAAYYLTKERVYAERLRAQLTSWWRANPFLRGIHWTSGIELGVRLLSWIWIRRLLSGWSDASSLFEHNPSFLRQLEWHQRYLSTLSSHSSSANNHVIAEQAGLFASSCAFPIFDDSGALRARSAAILLREVSRQTFWSGLNRELATGYHGFVLELCVAAGLEGEAAGYGLGAEFWELVQRMMDALAAVVDVRVNPPRQGDSDDGLGVLLDGPGFDRWSSLLATGEALFGRLSWWPAHRTADARTAFWKTTIARVRPPDQSRRPERRPAVFNDAGFVILRDHADTSDEIWCHCDHGQLGFLATAAHGHADALSVELRHGGTPIFGDPGTYCYQDHPAWRSFLRSTAAHNTLEVAGTSQSVEAGPFLWTCHAPCELLNVTSDGDGRVTMWQAEHYGYRRLRPGATHRRSVTLSHLDRTLTIADELVCSGTHPVRLLFHLGPTISCDLRGSIAQLTWEASGRIWETTVELPGALDWIAVRGQIAPPIGWYSTAFDQKEPTTTLLGSAMLGRGRVVTTRVTLPPVASR
jgi:hypothetical protein